MHYLFSFSLKLCAWVCVRLRVRVLFCAHKCGRMSGCMRVRICIPQKNGFSNLLYLPRNKWCVQTLAETHMLIVWLKYFIYVVCWPRKCSSPSYYGMQCTLVVVACLQWMYYLYFITVQISLQEFRWILNSINNGCRSFLPTTILQQLFNDRVRHIACCTCLAQISNIPCKMDKDKKGVSLVWVWAEKNP